MAEYEDGGLAVVRIKPLGAGGGGVERSAASAEVAAVQASAEGVLVGAASRRRLFKYPKHVIPPESDQEGLYNQFMPCRVGAFLAGYNVNITAYGQTGSGKTHTMFGPPGLMAEAASGAFGMDVCPYYGLCPRGVLEIIGRVQDMQGGPIRYELTASAVELTVADGNLDMFDKSKCADNSADVKWARFSGASGVVLERTTKPARLYGMTQVILDSADAVLQLFAAIACRNTAGTGLNDSSSRSHAFVFLNLHAYDPATQRMRVSRFQFVDLAGSERVRDAHGFKGWGTDTGAIEGIMTNFSLIMLSQRVRELVAARKQGKRREDLVKQSFKTQLDPDLIPLLGESLTGIALSLIIVCASSAPDNATQTINALDFGEVFSHLTVSPQEMPWKPIAEMQRQADQLIKSARHATPGGNDKYATIRAAQGRDGREMLERFARLAA